uniref:hypothetical protein n=1 Tax=Algoriphagus sp. TaxID=1872435 RepID=UPI0040477E76
MELKTKLSKEEIVRIHILSSIIKQDIILHEQFPSQNIMGYLLNYSKEIQEILKK